MKKAFVAVSYVLLVLLISVIGRLELSQSADQFNQLARSEKQIKHIKKVTMKILPRSRENACFY